MKIDKGKIAELIPFQMCLIEKNEREENNQTCYKQVFYG